MGPTNGDLYENLKDNDQMEMFRKTSFKTDLKVYGVAWGFVMLVILPWAVGICMLLKWLYKFVF